MPYEQPVAGEDGGAYVVSDDPARIDVDAVHAFLSASYWAAGIPRAVVAKSVRHSLAFGVYAADGGAMVGFARVITDRATFAYLADVFVAEPFRGRGLSKLLMEAIIAHPELQGLRHWLLLTADAHGLYEKFGWERTTVAERIMHRRPPVAYGPHATPGAPLPPADEEPL